MSNQEFCNQCPNHCSADSLKCGRGRAYFGDNSQTSHEVHNHHGFDSADNSVVGLLRQCGHYLHHNDGSSDQLTSCLSKEELATLESLLQKIVANLK